MLVDSTRFSQKQRCSSLALLKFQSGLSSTLVGVGWPRRVNVRGYENSTIIPAVRCIVDHLLGSYDSDVPYRLGGDRSTHGRPAAEPRVFKMARVSHLEDSVVWEHFQDMTRCTALVTSTSQLPEAVYLVFVGSLYNYVKFSPLSGLFLTLKCKLQGAVSCAVDAVLLSSLYCFITCYTKHIQSYSPSRVEQPNGTHYSAVS
jgi:hypothetical protein